MCIADDRLISVSENADLPHSDDRFTTLWRRAKDHRIAQWTVGYVAVAYGIRAVSRAQAGNYTGARQDLQEGLRHDRSNVDLANALRRL